MIAPTHAIYGPALALIILSVFGVEASFHWTVIVCAVFGAIAPDLDHPSSTIGRLFPWISKPIEKKFGHRAITHSALGTVVATIIFTIFLVVTITVLRWMLAKTISISLIPISLSFLHLELIDIFRLGAAFTIGYASHIALDMLTPRGVQLLWPSQSRHVIFQNSIRINTASKGEVPVALLGIVLLVLAFPLSQHGPMTTLRWFLATPEAAIAEYKNSPTATFVEFSGTWIATKRPIQGTAQILDVDNKRLVILIRDTPGIPSVPFPQSTAHLGAIPLPKSRANQSNPIKTVSDATTSKSEKEHPQKPGIVVTLSDELSADIISKKVRIRTTNEPIHQRVVTLTGKTRDELLSRLSDTDLISGVITLPKDMTVIIPNDDSDAVTGTGKWTAIRQTDHLLTLRFATKSQLAQLQLDENWNLSQKEKQFKLKQLLFQQRKLQRELRQIDSPNDGLTDLGRKILDTEGDAQRRNIKKESIEHQLEQVEFDVEKLSLDLAKKNLLFDVNVRLWKI